MDENVLDGMVRGPRADEKKHHSVVVVVITLINGRSHKWVSLWLLHPTYKAYNPIYNRFMCPPCRCSRWWFQLFFMFHPDP